MHLQGVQLGPQHRLCLALLFVPEVQMGQRDQQVQLLPVKYYIDIVNDRLQKKDGCYDKLRKDII